jgi:hypothetical protein
MLWAMVSDGVLFEEMWITGRDNGVTRQKSCMTMVGVQSVTLPRVMTENYLGSESTNLSGNFSPKFASVSKVSINLMHENNFTLRSQSASGFTLFDFALSN